MTDDDQRSARIEIYEWKAGKPRPGTEHRISDDVVDIVELPPRGQVPLVGDTIAIGDVEGDELVLRRYVVVDRELMWGMRPSRLAPEAPRPFAKAWLFVRVVDDRSYEQSAVHPLASHV